MSDTTLQPRSLSFLSMQEQHNPDPGELFNTFVPAVRRLTSPANNAASHTNHQQFIKDLASKLTRNPKRPGCGFTSQELGAAIALSQITGRNQNQQAYLTSFQRIFSPARATALLECIINDVSETANREGAVNTLDKMQQKLKTFGVPLIRYEKARQLVKELINKIVKRYSEKNERTTARQDATFYKLSCDRGDYQNTISIAITFLQTFHPHKIETWAEDFLDVSENESKSLKERVTTALRNICDEKLNPLPNTAPIPVSIPQAIIEQPSPASGASNASLINVSIIDGFFRGVFFTQAYA